MTTDSNALPPLGQRVGSQADPPDVAAATRYQAAVTAVGILAVVDEARTPLENVQALDPGVAQVPPGAADQPLATSGPDGRIRLEVASLPAGGAIALWKVGFAPRLWTAVWPDGPTREATVVLKQSHSVRMTIRRDDGSPVDEFRVLLSTAVPMSAGCLQQVHAAHVLRSDEAGGNVALGTSNRLGEIEMSHLARGRYFVQYNAGHLPVSCFGAPVYIDVPGPPTDVVVTECWAAAVEVIGDPVVAYNNPVLGTHSPIRSAASTLERATTDAATRGLKVRFPSAHVVVGFPRSQARTDRQMQLLVHGMTTGWSVHDVPFCRISDLSSVSTILLPPGSGPATGELRVVARDASNQVVDLPGGRALMEFQYSGFTAWVFLNFNQQLTVPSDAGLLHPAGELPLTAFAPLATNVRIGELKVIDVRVRDMSRYCLVARMADGGAPFMWGLQLGGDINGQSNPAGDSYTFYTSTPDIDYVARAQGYSPTKGSMHRGGGEQVAPNIEQFVVRFGALQRDR